MIVYKASASCLIPEIVAGLTVGDPLEKRIVFCEDKCNLSIELAIAKVNGGSFGTNVYSFNRFMHKNLPSDKKVLSPEGCALIVKGLLLENKKKLVCFKNVYDPNLASTVYELIAQLKSAKVTPEDIKIAYESSEGNLKRKLKDIYLLFSSYEQYINERGLTDGNNRLSRLPEFFSDNEDIKNTKVIIAGFPSLNKTLCEIFKSLIKNAKSVEFVVAAGDNSGVYTNETFNFVTNNFFCEINEITSTPIRNSLLNGLYNPAVYDKQGSYSGDIFLYRAKDLTSEIEYVAQQIKLNVIEKGAKYKNFAICAENIEEYGLIISRVFGDYDIPYFIDANRNLGKHPITRLICSYLDVVRRGFDLSDVFSFVKNLLFTTDKSLTDGFENYCIRTSMNRKKFKEPFVYEDERLEEYENIRLTVVEVAEYVAKNSTVAGVIAGINKMLERVNAFENLAKLGDELSLFDRGDLTAYNAQADSKYLAVVEDIVNLLGDKELSLVEVKNLILSGMTACKVGIIPEYNDCVFVGNFSSVRYNEVSTLFAVGLTDNVPTSKIDSALLCDRDIDKMERAKVLVEPKIKEVNRRAKECACMALSTFKNQLYVTYPEITLSGEEGKPSQIFSYLQAIFSSNDRQTKIHNADSYEMRAKNLGGERFKNYKARNYLTERSSTFAFAKEIGAYKEGLVDDFECASAYYKNLNNNKKEVANGILSLLNADVRYNCDNVNYAGNGLSATAIESYFKCPYANFLSRGVKLVEREEVTIKKNDLGTMIHDVGETFIRNADFSKDEEYIRNLASDIFTQVTSKEDYKRYQNNESGKKKFEFIREEAVKFCLGIYNSSKHSKLKPKHLEVSFGSKEYPAIKVNTKHGEMKVTGKIDRIDTDGENMVIIDYKTGQIHNSEKDLYTGANLQLYLYAKAFGEKYKPIGVYYFPVNNNYVNEDDVNDRVLVGKTLFDKDYAKLIDDNLENTDLSVYTNANLALVKKTGKMKAPGAMLSEKEFNSYMNYAQEISAIGLEEIADGVIITSPIKDNCEYCKYHGICGYDESLDDRTRDVFEIKKIDILRATGDAGDQTEENEDGGEN